ncbi:TPA: TetR family transcriptional regulator [Stenotrophomonas maltophilia]|nr:TetR family transcriptional regulator [Stenotrophomonas maltophilia]HDS0951769.1 TetR family transcriptional regulator [Stenotrophomonas maltophilia]HDS1025455.1 TetR family transcriptional regulator [Stenotrophomonas maltophilia]HDS1028192.1 TetR family transcriptional regulator [Stenotrophomonas maltophilia]HDS1029705.1 TetR family transcriptional regulator [Stenotrophomonas maltophilia]
MSERRPPQISSRKQPRQARSNDLVGAILQAAAQVLRDEGAPRFTTARVAERAGVSIGSLYQYFPNKAAILFRLQHDEWQQTGAMLRDILQRTDRPPLQRLRTLVQAFIQSECDEAQMRGALDDAAPLYRDAPEVEQARSGADAAMLAFMAETLPGASAAQRQLAVDLIDTTLGATGREFSSVPRTAVEISTYADAVADMFCAYLQQLGAR